MRTYGRVDGQWQVVQTDENGNDDLVWITTMIQCLKLNLGESPFFSQYGIPAKQSVIQQVWPDYNVAVTQRQFSGYFASLIIAKQPGRIPTYRINATTKQGAVISATIPA